MTEDRADVASSGRAAAAGVEGAQEGGQRPGAGTLPAAPSAPDGQAGTRNAALAINTSYVGFGYTSVQTPLGPRHSIRATMATGRTKEIAHVRHAAYAGEICARLAAATEELNEAAGLIVRDREDS